MKPMSAYRSNWLHTFFFIAAPFIYGIHSVREWEKSVFKCFLPINRLNVKTCEILDSIEEVWYMLNRHCHRLLMLLPLFFFLATIEPIAYQFPFGISKCACFMSMPWKIHWLHSQSTTSVTFGLVDLLEDL